MREGGPDQVRGESKTIRAFLLPQHRAGATSCAQGLHSAWAGRSGGRPAQECTLSEAHLAWSGTSARPAWPPARPPVPGRPARPPRTCAGSCRQLVRAASTQPPSHGDEVAIMQIVRAYELELIPG